MRLTTSKLYDHNAVHWSRVKPSLLSDFTARPYLLELCQLYNTDSVLDLGCGEGYFARELKKNGAGEILAIDISEKMIAQAKEIEKIEKSGIRYHSGDACNIDYLSSAHFELVIAVFLFNYLDTEQTTKVLKQIKRILKPGGRLIFAVPHPFFPFSSNKSAPFYFNNNDAGYFSGQNQVFEGEIFIKDGGSVPVRCVHKTLSNYFNSLKLAKFDYLPEIHELMVTKEHLELDKQFFSPLIDKPLHLVFNIQA